VRVHHWIQGLTISALISLPTPASPAESEPSAEPSFTPYVDRTIPIPPGYFLFTLNLNATRSEPPEARSTLGAGLGFGTGIVDGLTAEAAVGPLELWPEVRFQDLRFGLLYDLIDTHPFELEPTVHVTVNPRAGHWLSRVEPGVVMALRAGHEVRLDTGIYLPISIDKATAIGLSVPARAVIQLTRHVHTAVSSGASLPDLKGGWCSATIPLGVAAGYSAPLGDGVVITVTPSVAWPNFIMPAHADPIHTGSFVVGVTTDLLVHP
jgi:hypothetical protein